MINSGPEQAAKPQTAAKTAAVLSPFTACLPPLLDSLGWSGSRAQLTEAMPHFSESDLDQEGLLNTMANLRFQGSAFSLSLDHVDSRLLPCLFVPHHGGPMVLIKGDSQKMLAFVGQSGEYLELSPEPAQGTAIFFSPLKAGAASLLASQRGWFAKILGRFAGPLKNALLLSFFINLLAFATPLFVMALFDQIPFMTNPVILAYIVAGVGIFILSDFALRLLRSSLGSWLGARLGFMVDTEVFRRILYLPPSYTESASINAQKARIKDFETVREFFGGPTATALLDLPFITLLLFGMFIMAGELVLVPLIAMLLFLALAMAFKTAIRNANENDTQAGVQRQEVLMEVLTKLRAVKYSASRSMWSDRFRGTSADYAMSVYRTSQLLSLMTIATNALIMGAGVATMAVGVHAVLAGALSMGALVGAMFLVWRILTPLRTGFMVLMQVSRIKKSVRQLDRLMGLDLEQRPEASTVQSPNMQGGVLFDQVSLRYSPDAHPALMGVSFRVEAGETLIIAGHEGSGKSTVLKLIMAMYAPQAGRILLDQTNLRQLPAGVLRSSLAYAPETPQFFYGTIAQNLRLARSNATDEQLRAACRAAHLLHEIEALPDGFGTRIGDFSIGQMSAPFWNRLDIARALLRQAPVYLLDGLLDRLDETGAAEVMNSLQSIKRSATIILVANNPYFFPLADKLLWLENGRVKAFGPAGEMAGRVSQQSFCVCEAGAKKELVINHGQQRKESPEPA